MSTLEELFDAARRKPTFNKPGLTALKKETEYELQKVANPADYGYDLAAMTKKIINQAAAMGERLWYRTPKGKHER